MNRTIKAALAVTLGSALIAAVFSPVSFADTSTAKTADPNAIVISAEKAAKAKG